ncbi:hypothetical protein [Bailinhaonella thermotolerans]|nr:hypothetical protein [Bailinhaonella thermotolerans]
MVRHMRARTTTGGLIVSVAGAFAGLSVLLAAPAAADGPPEPPPPPAAPVRGGECPGGDGLLGGLTGGLCEVADGLTDVLDGLTGGGTKDATKPADDALGDTLGGAKDAEEKFPGSGQDGQDGQGRQEDREDEDDREGAAPGQRDDEGSGASPAPAAPPKGEDGQGAAGPRPNRTSTWTIKDPDAARERPGRATPPPGRVPADTGDTRVPLLWGPGPVAPTIAAPQTPAPPAREPYDAIGTALTAALLLSAVLATRIVSTRQAESSRPGSMPFEPVNRQRPA